MSGQRLQLTDVIHLGDQLEEQPQLADFDRLLHDVHAVEVPDDDRLEDEVGGIGVPSNVFQHGAEVLELLGRCSIPQTLQILKEGLHPVEAGFVERLQDVEGGKQERPGAARWVEDGDAGNRLVEGPEEFGAFRGQDGIFGKSPDVEVVA